MDWYTLTRSKGLLHFMTKFNLATLRSRLSSATVPLIAAAVMAVTAPSIEATDLMDVYEAAKDDDPVLGAARASFAASQQAVPQARAGILPSLNASASTSFTDREFPGVPTLDERGRELSDGGSLHDRSNPCAPGSLWHTLRLPRGHR